MMKFRPLIAFAFTAVSLAGCTKSVDPANTPNGTEDTSTVAQDNARTEQIRQAYAEANVDRAAAAKAVRTFGAELYRSLQSQSGKEANLALSPWSVENALIMTAAGAKGDTLAQMLSTLGFGIYADSPESMQTSFADLSKSMLENAREYEEDGSRDDDTILQAANAIWVANELKPKLRPEFQGILRDVHQAEINTAPFRSDAEGARETINKWVADHTDDKIEDLLPGGFIRPSTSMVLTNAVAFDADWMHAFDEKLTKEEDFHRLDGTTSRVRMMNQRINSASYWTGDNFIGVALPYEGGDYAMSIVVPEAGHFAQVRDVLFQDGWETVFPSRNNWSEGQAQVALPKFKFRWSGQLAEVLKGMGMEHAFDGRANFTGMFSEGNEVISQVIHEVYIDVDEDGTEAAAATGVGMMRTSMPMEPPMIQTIRADRPFLFIIQDTASGTPVFMGQVVDPSASARD